MNSCFCKIPRARNVLGAMVNGLPHPQVPNAVYFSTLHEVQGAHQAMLTQALQEQHAWYQYHLQQSKLLAQQMIMLQQQQIQQQYEEVYKKIVFHQQQIAFLAAQQISA